MDSVFYLGACTPKGFVSHYGSLLDELRTLTIIKGGSGCGKSTFMRQIGRAAQERGLAVSYILCSSDPDSLDAVLLPELSLGFVDGTAPHVCVTMSTKSDKLRYSKGIPAQSSIIKQAYKARLPLSSENRTKIEKFNTTLNRHFSQGGDFLFGLL